MSLDWSTSYWFTFLVNWQDNFCRPWKLISIKLFPYFSSCLYEFSLHIVDKRAENQEEFLSSSFPCYFLSHAAICWNSDPETSRPPRLSLQLFLFIYFTMTAGRAQLKPFLPLFVRALRRHPPASITIIGAEREGGKMESHCVNAFWNMSHGTHSNHPKWSIQWSVTVQRRLPQTASACPLSLGTY